MQCHSNMFITLLCIYLPGTQFFFSQTDLFLQQHFGEWKLLRHCLICTVMTRVFMYKWIWLAFGLFGEDH